MMMMNFACRILAGLALALVLAGVARAQAFPSKPISIVVPFPPGGTLDALARIVGQKMSENMGQSVVIDNRSGAGGIIGYQYVAKAPADGYTIVTIANSFAVNPAVRNDLPFDALKDFAPITSLGATPLVLAVNPSVPAQTVAELVALAKRAPESITYGTFGEGSYYHLVGKMFEKAAGVRLTQVPFRGSAASIAAVLGNQISMVFGNLPEIVPHMKTGKLKALGLPAAARSPLAPNLPTMAELGHPGFTAESWYGLVAPAGTPPEVLARLQREVARALQLPDVKERMTLQSVYGGGESQAEFAASLRALMASYAAIARETNIRANPN